MEEAGQRLKRKREDLGLRYRDVEEATTAIAQRYGNPEYAVSLSRLADIENKGTVPSLFKLYSLCAVYRIDIIETLSWYSIDVTRLPADSNLVEVPGTHIAGFQNLGMGSLQVPLALDPGLDPKRTTYLSRMIQRWGLMPVMLLAHLDLQRHRYAFIGTEDWSMYPILHPGSLLLIDESRKKIVNAEWKSEYERPVYFLEHRDGYICGWCSLKDSTLVVQPHPSSHADPAVFACPEEIEVVGQVVGVAMRLFPAKQLRTRS